MDSGSNKELRGFKAGGRVPYSPLSWMDDSANGGGAMVSSGVHCYWDGREVSQEEWDALFAAKIAVDKESRSEKEFNLIADAFAYADTLKDGVVLDWGRCYAAMEREGLKIGFVIEPYEQPIVTREDLLIQPAPPHILARRIGDRGSSTCFSDDAKSWSEAVYEVIADANGVYEAGQILWTRLVPNESARPSVNQNWRMKLLRPEDVQAVIPK